MRVLAGCALLLAGVANAQVPQEQSAGQQPPEADVLDEIAFGNLAAKTDAELTALTARWPQLSPVQRRMLLAEVRGRMKRSQSRPRLRLRLPVQRQYGRVQRPPSQGETNAQDDAPTSQGRGVVRKTLRMRQADGTVITRTEVVQLDAEGKPVSVQSRVTFGTGFEKRSARAKTPPVDPHQPLPPPVQPPIVTVKETNEAPR